MLNENLFQKTIQNYLEKRAETDSLFAPVLKKENKTIEGCCNYIISEVRKSKRNGFADEEIYGLAVHYYQEDNLEEVKSINGRVVVNHVVEDPQSDVQIKSSKPTSAKKATPKIVTTPSQQPSIIQQSLF